VAGSQHPTVRFGSPAEWEAWLDRSHSQSDGVWLALVKKAAGVPGVSYADALDAALCFGWIDGQRRALDDRFFVQHYTPRRSRSRWSQINRARAEALAAAGRMRPAGAAEIDRAQRDGRWEAAYPGQRSAVVPDDLSDALAANSAARAFFETLDRANRYAILYRVHDANRPSTRAQRISRFVEMLAAGQTLHP
jgi:uncharacterized protein YdeI (YjbR/CyaY-like superfamily)